MLKRVAFRGRSQLEKIGYNCFARSGIEELLAPPGLREIGQDAFAGCEDLRLVVLNEGLERLVAEKEWYDNGRYRNVYDGIFGFSGVEEIVLPSTLK